MEPLGVMVRLAWRPSQWRRLALNPAMHPACCRGRNASPVPAGGPSLTLVRPLEPIMEM